MEQKIKVLITSLVVLVLLGAAYLIFGNIKSSADINPAQGTLSGQVLTAETQEPIAGAEISVFSINTASPVVKTTTDNTGRFSLTGLNEGNYDVEAKYQALTWREHDVIIVAGTVTTVNFSFKNTQTGKIVVNVRYEDATPVVGANVIVSQDSVMMTEGATDSAGVYSYGGLVGTYDVMAYTKDNRQVEHSVVISANKTTNVDFVFKKQLVEAGKITGIVKDAATGAALSNVKIELSNGGIAYTTYTNASGEYSLANIPAGTYMVMAATLANYEKGTASNVVVTVNGNTVQNFNLVMQKGNLTGKVYFGSKVASNASIALYQANSTKVFKSTKSDAYGNYSFNGIPVGNYKVKATYRQYLIFWRTYTGTADLTITANQTTVSNIYVK